MTVHCAGTAGPQWNAALKKKLIEAAWTQTHRNSLTVLAETESCCGPTYRKRNQARTQLFTNFGNETEPKFGWPLLELKLWLRIKLKKLCKSSSFHFICNHFSEVLKQVSENKFSNFCRSFRLWLCVKLDTNFADSIPLCVHRNLQLLPLLKLQPLVWLDVYVMCM